jgi:hypothetical protein
MRRAGAREAGLPYWTTPRARVGCPLCMCRGVFAWTCCSPAAVERALARALARALRCCGSCGQHRRAGSRRNIHCTVKHGMLLFVAVCEAGRKANSGGSAVTRAALLGTTKRPSCCHTKPQWLTLSAESPSHLLRLTRPRRSSPSLCRRSSAPLSVATRCSWLRSLQRRLVTVRSCNHDGNTLYARLARLACT